MGGNDSQEVRAENRKLAGRWYFTWGTESKTNETLEVQDEICKLILQKPRLKGFTASVVCVTKSTEESA